MADTASAASRSKAWRVDAFRAVTVFVALAVTLGGLHTILQGASWWLLCVVLCAAMVGSGVIVRRALSARMVLARFVAPLVALCVASFIVMLRFGGGTGFAKIIPNSETWEHFGALFAKAGPAITWQTVPAKADESILFVLALGVIALVLVAEIAVFSLRLPALIGVPLAVVFVIPGLTPEGKTSGLFFAASAVAYLAVLLVGRHWRVGPAFAMASIAVVGGLVLPAALPDTDFALTTSDIGPSVTTGVNPILNLGENLRDNQKRTALTYSTVSGQPEYLRLAVISDFTGNSWGPGQPSLNPQNRPVEFPRPTGLTSGVSTMREVTYVRVANLTSPWLPVPYAATRITGLTGSWKYLADSFTVASESDLARGENYTVATQKITPTPDQFLAAGTSVPPQLDGYLSLPVDTPSSIARTADAVTGDVHSNYEKALALQDYLRSEPFTYSETAPRSDNYDDTGVQYVATFLEQHRGYCIHFASAMAVMAREIGIPSRIIVGFQPGTLQNKKDQGRRVFAVTTKDLHAWPELYFDGIGWVRFEPTPSRGSVPEYADQSIVGVPTVTAADSGDNGDDGATGRDPAAGSPLIDDGPVGASAFSRGSSGGWLVFGGVLGTLLVVMLLPAALRKWRRWTRLARVASGHEAVVTLWLEIGESAEDVGNPLGSALTPREVVERLRRLPGMTESSRDALERVRTAVESEGYGPPQTEGNAAAHARRALVDNTKVVLAALSAGAPNDERLRAFLLPPSLVTRTRAAVTRTP